MARKPGALTYKQKVFVEQYLICWNAAEASRRAGYKASPDVQGAQNLVKPSIRALIDARLEELGMGAQEVLARLASHAKGDVRPFLVTHPDGTVEFDLRSEEAQNNLHLIKELRQKRRVIPRGRGEEPIIEVETELKIHDPQAALQLLGRYHKLFHERPEFNGEMTVHVVYDPLPRNPALPSGEPGQLLEGELVVMEPGDG